MSTDRYLDRRYSASNYNCAHFAIDVIRDLTGQDLEDVLHGFLCAPSKRRADFTALRRIKFLARPESPCIAFFQHRIQPPHVGVWYKGKILHISEAGVQYMPLDIAMRGFTKVRFFKCQ